jgi:PAS domain S-box-containing protein
MTDEVTSVLLIDDDEDEYVLHRDLLSEIDGPRIRLDWVPGYEEGLEDMLDGSHDAYIIDYALGARSGLDLLETLREKGIQRSVIFLTGRGDEKVDRRALELGASDYLVKGEINPLSLGRAVRYAVENYRIQGKLRFQAEILRNIHDAVFYVNQDGIVLDWNEGAVRIFGLCREDAIGKPLKEICPAPPGKHPFEERIIPAIQSRGIAEEVVHCADGSGNSIYILTKVTPMSRGDETGYVFCASDITKEKELEGEIVRISENEQRRIGQDIHDDLCSQLSGIGCLTKFLEQKLKKREHEEADLMAKITEMISSAGTKARQIARGLVPTVLETQGLAGAIRELASRQRELYSIDCSATIEGEESLAELEETVAVQFYRIAQEAVANAIRHSDAE